MKLVIILLITVIIKTKIAECRVNILKYWLHFVAKSYFTSTKNKESRVIFSLTPITKYVHWFYSGKTRWLNNKHETQAQSIIKGPLLCTLFHIYDMIGKNEEFSYSHTPFTSSFYFSFSEYYNRKLAHFFFRLFRLRLQFFAFSQFTVTTS